MTPGGTWMQQVPASLQEEPMSATQENASSLWPDRPAPLRQRLTDYIRAYRVAQRLIECYGKPVAIIEQDCLIQSHCVLWGDDIFHLELQGRRPKPYRLVPTVF